MVLIMANINCLVILICSTVFLFSSFVSSQQKRKPIEVLYSDPLEFYNYAVFLSRNYPEYYAANYPKLSAEYQRISYESKEKRNTINYATLKKNILPRNTGMGAVKPVNNIDRPSRNIMVNDYRSTRKESQPRGTKFSRSLTSTESPVTEAFAEDLKKLPVAEKRETKVEQEWNQHCYMLGYNNTNKVCQSDPSEEIKLAPNKEICQKYIELGCQYRSSQESCNIGVIEVLKNITFDCRDINIKSDDDMMSLQCCMSCKGGINTATSADTCDMHLDSSLPSLAQEFCCNKFLKPKVNESVTTESNAASEKPMDEVIAMLDERLSNSSVNKPFEIDDSAISATSVSPTTTTTTPAITTSTTTTITTTPATTTITTTTTETPDTATPSTASQAATTPSTETPTEPITPTTATSTTPATSAELTTTPTSPTTPTLPTSTNTNSSTSTFGTREAMHSDELIEGYKRIENENNIYQKIDIKDGSKADYLVILNKDLKIENKGGYKNFKLMNLTLRNDIKCDWAFNFEKANAYENGGETLSALNFEGKPEGSSYILLLDGEVVPQTVQYSVECNIKKYKYYKYQVYLDFINSSLKD